MPSQLPSGPPHPTYSAPGHSDLAVPSQPALVGPADPAPGHSDPPGPTGPPSGPPQPTYPAPGQSDSLVPNARWGGPVLCGGTAPVAFPRGRACFWAPALRFCVGCRRGPAQNRSTASSKARKSRIGPEVAARQRGVRSRVAEVAARRRGRPPEPKAEARIPCDALPTPNYAKINLIESPQIHSLPRRTDTTGAANNALWTPEGVVDNQLPPQDHPNQEPPIYSLPRKPDTTGAPTSSLWTVRAVVDNHHRSRRSHHRAPAHPSQKPPAASTTITPAAAGNRSLQRFPVRPDPAPPPVPHLYARSRPRTPPGSGLPPA
ncbi:hypothetical protein LV75_000777 [Actinokineospora diospyrosa]|uniref:Uncharacterized protein n=1 Tax=Actinokineospora diospyrosa TaxID=103728 RepID=A0ABT1I7B8_9PSEU|nr:hypothetical protein [Actinokineospora diospyrosa]